MRSSPISLALPWFTRTDYRFTVDGMADRARFPADYEIWLEHALQTERELASAGIMTCRLVIDNDAFLPWCDLRGIVPGQTARTAYVDEMTGFVGRSNDRDLPLSPIRASVAVLVA